ncbi:MAG: MarR family winged helix-turn-helix transcriptional regulator [Paracoccus sp. (in: a-proteobacteria)]|nr:MarR family winged helix-turn-helix transcriptional regulator [Paracoccus sp. (in: a-proteobacteria)]
MQAEDQAEPDADGLPVDLGILGGMLSWYFRVIELHLSRDLNEHLENFDIVRGKGKIPVLLLIAQHPGIRASVIADVTMLNRSVIARILDGFQQAGLVRREMSFVDNRALDLTLTDAGIAMAARIREIITRQSAAFFSFLPPQDHDRLLDILRRTYVHLHETRP